MTVEHAVDDFRSQLVDVLGRHATAAGRGPLRMRRQGDRWTLRAPIGAVKVFLVSPGRLTIDDEQVTLLSSSGSVSIVEAGIRDQTLTVALEMPADALPVDWSSVLGQADRQLRELAGDDIRATFLRRAIRGVGKVAARVPLDDMAEASAEATDVAVLVRAFEHPDVLEPLRNDDPLAPARVRGLREREHLLVAEGGTWDVNAVAAHLQLTRQAVNRRRQKNALLALDAGRRGFLYPAWQFTRRGTVTGLEPVLDALRPHDPWMRQAFMLAPNIRLDEQTPVSALRAGRTDDVVEAAAAYGEHGAA